MFACKCNKNLFKLKSVTNIYLNIDQNIFAMILFGHNRSASSRMKISNMLIKLLNVLLMNTISFNNIYVAFFKDTKCFTSNKTRN